MKSFDIFAELVKAFSYKRKENAPLCNFTFFLGAGFSKSWDERFPVGNQLFEFKYEDWEKKGHILAEYLSLSNYDVHGLTITPGLFKDIVYQIGMLKKYPAIRPRYLDASNIDMLERELRALVVEKFKATAPLYYFDEDTQKVCFDGSLTNEQRSIFRLFSKLLREGDGSQGVSEGVRAHFMTTNYDFTIDAILDNCVGPDDSFTLYSYRGITPRLVCGQSNPAIIHDHWLVNNLLKINGGFEMYDKDGVYELDYREKKYKDIRIEPPQIMLPSREQDYLQTYFQELFPKAVRLLQETTVLVIVGYSLPEEDALIRLILKQFAEDRADGDNKVVFYVDLADEKAQIKRMNEVFPHSKERRGLKIVPYSGRFSDWAEEVVRKIA